MTALLPDLTDVAVDELFASAELAELAELFGKANDRIPPVLQNQYCGEDPVAQI
ncbi:hypothetical protein [Actinocrispum sp. NPDC049592]|uniref:hypothetical protein n=1 Tax=Actinocrispum sp. NPDC049592 TaxID=3154835 RepID=UPI003431B700